MTMKRRVIYLILLVVVAGTGIYMFNEYNRKNKDLLKEKTAFTIDASSLILAYENDAQLFSKAVYR